MVCWGANSHGQTEIPPLENPRFISSGLGNHSCALDDTGVVCWGDNQYQQASNLRAVRPILSAVRPIDVSVGYTHSCALDDSGVTCWGRNIEGQTNVPELLEPRQLAVGGNHSCAQDKTGRVCWGYQSEQMPSQLELADINWQ